MDKVILRFAYTEDGFCRTHFSTLNQDKQLIHYCIQDEAEYGIFLYRCSTDGEPNYVVKVKDWETLEFEQPDDHYGKSLLDKYLKVNGRI